MHLLTTLATVGSIEYGSFLPGSQTRIDITYPRNASAWLDAGHYLHVPLLLGSNENERDPFLVATELIQPGFVLPAVSRAMVDIQTSVRLLAPLPHGEKINHLTFFSPKFQFTCPDNATISFRVRDAEVPTFRYQYQGKSLSYMSCMVQYFINLYPSNDTKHFPTPRPSCIPRIRNPSHLRYLQPQRSDSDSPRNSPLQIHSNCMGVLCAGSGSRFSGSWVATV